MIRRALLCERGFGTVELMVAVALTAIVVVGGFGVYQASSRGGQVGPSVQTLTDAVEFARQQAASSGSLGATLTVTPKGQGFTAVVYPYRPIPGSGAVLTDPPVTTYAGRATVTAVGIGTTFSVFIAPSGSTQNGDWTPSSGFVTPAACTTDLSVAVGIGGSDSVTKTIPCAYAALR